MNFTYVTFIRSLKFLSISKYTNVAYFFVHAYISLSVSELLWQILIWNTYLKPKPKYFIYHQQQHISEFFCLFACMHLLLCTCLKETRVLSIFFLAFFIRSIYFSSAFYVTFIVWRVMRFNSPCVLFTLCFMRIRTSFAFENSFTFARTPFE